jgi:hypothetical protein
VLLAQARAHMADRQAELEQRRLDARFGSSESALRVLTTDLIDSSCKLK